MLFGLVLQVLGGASRFCQSLRSSSHVLQVVHHISRHFSDLLVKVATLELTHWVLLSILNHLDILGTTVVSDGLHVWCLSSCHRFWKNLGRNSGVVRHVHGDSGVGLWHSSGLEGGIDLSVRLGDLSGLICSNGCEELLVNLGYLLLHLIYLFLIFNYLYPI